MHYEINVSKHDGSFDAFGNARMRHYFATAPRSLSTKLEAQEMYEHFIGLFHTPTFNVTVSRWVNSGTNVTEEM